MTPRSQWLQSEFGPLVAVWYEPATDFRTAVLVLPSIGHEENLMHDGVTELARRLTSAGSAVLIVQPLGCDQSSGSFADVDVMARWNASVRAALDELVRSGAAHLQLVAIRLGALMLGDEIQLLPTRHQGARIDDVVLWSPTTSGRRFTRTLRVLNAAADQVAANAVDSINVGGFEYPEQMLAEVGQHSLTAHQLASARRVLVVHHQNRGCEPGLLEAVSEVTALTTIESPDIGDWADGEMEGAPLPADSLAKIAAWMDLDHPQTTPVAGRVGERHVAAEPEGVSETFVAVSPTVNGVFHPGDGSDQAALLLLSTNGPGRRFLEIARAESARGRAVLRFDFAGTRWSGDHVDGRPTFSYDQRGLDDVVAAAQWLRTQGHQSIVAVGFCAGARVLIAAAPLAKLRALVAINVELFESLRRQPNQVSRYEKYRAARIAFSIGRWWSGRHGAIASLNRLQSADVHSLLVFDDSDQGIRFLRSLRHGRAVIAGSLSDVQVRSRSGIGHNLEGPTGASVISDVNEVLARFDAAPEPVPR